VSLDSPLAKLPPDLRRRIVIAIALWVASRNAERKRWEAMRR
jgi:hypothetical protein